MLNIDKKLDNNNVYTLLSERCSMLPCKKRHTDNNLNII